MPAYFRPLYSSADAVVDQHDHHHHHEHRSDREPQVGEQVDRLAGIQQLNGVVGNANKDAVHRNDHDIYQEHTRHGREGQREAGQRMAPNTDERGPGQRDQHQVAGIGRDAGNDADESQDPGQRPGRRDDHQLADQRLDQPGLLGHTDPDHRDDDHADRLEAHEVRDHAGEHEADAVGSQ
jgi:hypothetical protein